MLDAYQLLVRAQTTVKERGQDYGDKFENHQRIADIWSIILGTEIKAEQVALCMAGTKIARLIQSPTHEDSWLDLAGYAAVGSECAKSALTASNEDNPHPLPHSQSTEQSQSGDRNEGQ
jgi:hypothetical protein